MQRKLVIRSLLALPIEKLIIIIHIPLAHDPLPPSMLRDILNAHANAHDLCCESVDYEAVISRGGRLSQDTCNVLKVSILYSW